MDANLVEAYLLGAHKAGRFLRHPWALALGREEVRDAARKHSGERPVIAVTLAALELNELAASRTSDADDTSGPRFLSLSLEDRLLWRVDIVPKLFRGEYVLDEAGALSFSVWSVREDKDLLFVARSEGVEVGRKGRIERREYGDGCRLHFEECNPPVLTAQAYLDFLRRAERAAMVLMTGYGEKLWELGSLKEEGYLVEFAV